MPQFEGGCGGDEVGEGHVGFDAPGDAGVAPGQQVHGALIRDFCSSGCGHEVAHAP